MPQTVSCVLPPAVERYLIHTFHRPALAVLLIAVKERFGASTAHSASIEAGREALARGVTKSDIYREALIAFAPEVAELWPRAPIQRAGAAARSARLIHLPPAESADTRELGVILAKLESLRADLPRLSTARVNSRFDTVLKKTRRLHERMVKVLADKRAASADHAVALASKNL